MNWAQAFARQAGSDLDARETLVADQSLPPCHSLHFLQMACEKVCKASMIYSGVNPKNVHTYVAKHLPIIVRSYMSRDAGRWPKDNWMVEAIRPLAKKIELLSPSAKDGGRSPENCEYPWLSHDGSRVTAPADHKFDFDILYEKAGIALLKIVRQVATELQK